MSCIACDQSREGVGGDVAVEKDLAGELTGTGAELEDAELVAWGQRGAERGAEALAKNGR